MPGPVRSGAHTTPARENYAPPASRESESPESVHQPPRPGAQSRSLSVPPDARPECSRRTPRSAPARARSPPLPGPPFPSPFSQPHDAVLTQVRIGRFPARAIEIAPPEVRCFPQARPAGRRYSQRYEQGVSARPTGGRVGNAESGQVDVARASLTASTRNGLRTAGTMPANRLTLRSMAGIFGAAVTRGQQRVLPGRTSVPSAGGSA